MQALQWSPRGRSKKFYTLVHLLSQEESKLFARIQKRTQSSIRQAYREDLEFMLITPDIANIRDFCEFYNEFAVEKGRALLQTQRLEELAEAGMLRLSAAKRNGTVLVMHSHVYTSRRARLLHSASHFRTAGQSSKNAIGRANKWLHWQDVLYFKRLGLAEYDFGGWYEGSEDLERLSINRFKESFGAEIELNYNVVCAASLKGTLYLTMLSAYSQFSQWLGRLRTISLPGFRNLSEGYTLRRTRKAAAWHD